jgi:hypothetical protein
MLKKKEEKKNFKENKALNELKNRKRRITTLYFCFHYIYSLSRQIFLFLLMGFAVIKKVSQKSLKFACFSAIHNLFFLFKNFSEKRSVK